MKRIASIVLYIFFCSYASGQQGGLPPMIYSDTKSINTLSLYSDFFFASNAITNELAKTYFLNGFITDEMKDAVSKNLKDKNRLGGEFTTEIYFRHKPDSLFGIPELSWFIGFKNINHVSSTFTRDLFEVYFRGNKNYAGQTAVLGEFNYLLLKYQQLQFGVSKVVKKKTSVFEGGAAVGFNIGQQLQIIHSPKTDLYTEDIGEYIDINTSIETHNSDSLHKYLGALNGFGLSTDLFFKAEIKKEHFFSLKISNLGFIRWNNNSTALKEDSSFHFEGVDVSNILNFSDTIKRTISIDSTQAQAFLTKRKYLYYTLVLPAKIEFSYMKAMTAAIRAGIGVNFMTNADYVPQVHVDGDYSWKNNFAAISFSYGGYAVFGAGVYYRHSFHHGYVAGIGSNYVNSLLDSSAATSESIYVSIYRNF